MLVVDVVLCGVSTRSAKPHLRVTDYGFSDRDIIFYSCFICCQMVSVAGLGAVTMSCSHPLRVVNHRSNVKVHV